MKLCSRCGEPKLPEAFRRNSTKKDGLQSWCKPCAGKHATSYLRERRYTLDPLQYAVLRDSQDGKCAICRRDQAEFHYSFAVDHDHNCCPGSETCGSCTRGLLCLECNRGLGAFRDDTHALIRAVAYLAR